MIIRYGSFCAGIDAPQQSLKDNEIPHTVEFACEIDKYARQTYLANHEEPKIFYEDLTKIDFNTVSDVDLFIAGWPCQDLSVAGLGKGLDGNRSVLILNIIEYLRIKRPPVFILENVPGLLTKKHIHIFKYIMSKIAKQVNRQTSLVEPEKDCLDYDVYWKVLNGVDFEIPQDRDRVFIVGFAKENNEFVWPAKIPLQLRLKDLLDANVDEKYYVSEKTLANLMKHSERHKEKGNGFGMSILDTSEFENSLGGYSGGGFLERNLITRSMG